ncbi:hypothetical protein [Nesterenkonia alba]|uniref:hypothetical protein n=1 Tax=Nesterenkonia alba TaxID=515814 RepID=UPI0003B6F6A8|nr:hypothetical protein [Nesterenkonia alba]
MTKYRYAGPAASLIALLELAAREGISVTRTKLAKLLYLADLQATEDGLAATSGTPWIWYNYGPWARELIVAEEALVREGIAEREVGENYYGTPQTTLSLKHAPRYAVDEEFYELMAATVREYGRLSPSSLKDLTYTTAPMLEAQKTQRGVRLDLTGRRPVKPMAKTLKKLAKHRESRQPVGTVPEEVQTGLVAEFRENKGWIRRANEKIL